MSGYWLVMWMTADSDMKPTGTAVGKTASALADSAQEGESVGLYNSSTFISSCGTGRPNR